MEDGFRRRKWTREYIGLHRFWKLWCLDQYIINKFIWWAVSAWKRRKGTSRSIKARSISMGRPINIIQTQKYRKNSPNLAKWMWRREWRSEDVRWKTKNRDWMYIWTDMISRIREGFLRMDSWTYSGRFRSRKRRRGWRWRKEGIISWFIRDECDYIWYLVDIDWFREKQ